MQVVDTNLKSKQSTVFDFNPGGACQTAAGVPRSVPLRLWHLQLINKLVFIFVLGRICGRLQYLGDMFINVSKVRLLFFRIVWKWTPYNTFMLPVFAWQTSPILQLEKLCIQSFNNIDKK